MTATIPRTLNHFSLLKFNDEYFRLGKPERKKIQQDFLREIQKSATRVDIFQVYPTNMNWDI